MRDPYRIRPAAPADLEAIAALERESFPDAWSVAAFAAHLSDVFLVAALDGRVCGYVVARDAGGEAEVVNLAVARALRRRGIARRLLGSVYRRLTAAGARSLFLEVRASNDGARALYAREGFHTVGRRRRYYVDPVEDALVLAKRLAPPADA